MAIVEAANYSAPHEMMEELDQEIYDVRNQIQELTKRRRLVTNTLLSSTRIQQQLNQHAANNSSRDLPTDENPLSNPTSETSASTSATTHQTNMHRLSFTVTTFPFTDPSPNSAQYLHGRLLGIRLDHCSRNGTFKKPYYMLLRRIEKGGDEWRVHRHTIPAFVALDRLQDEFLPVREEDEERETGRALDTRRGTTPSQDLHRFVRKVRHELICWELRREAIELLKEKLGLIKPEKAAREADDSDQEMADDGEEDEDDADDADGGMDDDDDDTAPRTGLYGVQSIEATAFEARQARITWTDGTVARIKISNRGLVERAVVVGESGRIKGVENLLVDGESRIEDLVQKLKVLVGAD